LPRPTARPVEPTRPNEPAHPAAPARPQRETQREIPQRETPPRETPSHEASRGPAFPAPMNFSLGQQAQSRPPVARQPSSRGSIDMAFAPKSGGSSQLSASVKMDGVDVSTDWLNAVSAWWRRHGYYPDEAGNLGEQGDVTLHMIVARDGQVSALELERRSGSQWLDLGALSVFRDAHLPPLTPDMPEGQIPLHFTIHYVIIRQD
jgi:protein TonB